MSLMSENCNVKKNIIIVGDFGSGKTSLLHRFINKEFTKIFINTSLDFHSYEMKHKEEVLQVFIWDSLGHERFQSMTDSFYKKADGVVLVFDITEEKIGPVVSRWVNTVTDKCSPDIPIIVVGNKRDICSIYEQKIKEVVDAVSKSNNIIKIVTASARNGDNVDDLFKKVIIAAYEMNPGLESEMPVKTPEVVDTDNCCCFL